MWFCWLLCWASLSRGTRLHPHPETRLGRGPFQPSRVVSRTEPSRSERLNASISCWLEAPSPSLQAEATLSSSQVALPKTVTCSIPRARERLQRETCSSLLSDGPVFRCRLSLCHVLLVRGTSQVPRSRGGNLTGTWDPQGCLTVYLPQRLSAYFSTPNRV